MKKLLLISVAALVLFTVGCQLDAPILPKKTDTTGTKGGNSTGGTTVTPNSDSYQPVTKDSYWKFAEITGNATNTETHTITGTTATFNNKLYYTFNIVSTALGNTTGYYYHGNDSYSYRGTSAGFTVEYLYLKDNYAVGKTWTAPITDNGTLNSVSAQLIGQILESGISKTVSGKTFANVIHTQLLIQYDMGNGFETIQTQDYYIAKGIGIIEGDGNTSGLISTSKLSEFTVK
jgi:hypothetical protein